jgi:hypothetical protein
LIACQTEAYLNPPVFYGSYNMTAGYLIIKMCVS